MWLLVRTAASEEPDERDGHTDGHEEIAEEVVTREVGGVAHGHHVVQGGVHAQVYGQAQEEQSRQLGE